MDVVPSTVHLKIFFYNEDGKLEVSKVDQTSYAIYASFGCFLDGFLFA